jgi:Leucine Rich repeat
VTSAWCLILDPRVDRPTMTSHADAYLHDEKVLYLTSYGIDSEQAKQIANELAANTTLKFLDLSDNEVGELGAPAIAHALTKNRTLTRLDLDDNGIGNVGSVTIAMALLQNMSLQTLFLCGNGIDPAGAASFAETLRINTCLVELRLARNNIGDNGAELLARAVAENHSLVQLNFHSCNIGDAGLTALAQALEYNTSLIGLRLSDNTFGIAGLTSIAFVLTENTGLAELNLGDNTINDDGAAVLAGMLRRNSTVMELHLQDNDVSDAGATSILNALTERNTELSFLDLTGNDNISSSILSAIETIVEANMADTRSIIHPIVCQSPNKANRSTALAPHGTEPEPEIQVALTPEAGMRQTTTTHPMPAPGTSASFILSLVNHLGTHDTASGEGKAGDTKWMEGLPKRRAELEFEIRLLAAIRDATFQQGIAAKKKLNVLQTIITAGKYLTEEGLERMVDDLTGETQEKAPIESLSLVRPCRSSDLALLDMSPCADNEAIADACRRVLSAFTSQPMPSPGASVSSTTSGAEDNPKWMDWLQEDELGFEIRRIATVRDAAVKIIRLMQTAIASGKYPTGEELEGMIKQLTGGIRE